jgi:hypothetical protein
MGYKTRERKRKRAAIASAARARRRDQRQARSSGSSASKWWLTIASSKCCCANTDCGTIIGEGREVVYRHTPRATVCVPCANRDKLSYRPSVRWEQWRRKQRRAA